jgi:hypothetical protein
MITWKKEDNGVSLGVRIVFKAHRHGIPLKNNDPWELLELEPYYEMYDEEND